MLFLGSQAQAKEVQSVAGGLVSIFLGCECNANRSGRLLPPPALMGKPVGLTNNLKTIVEGSDFVFEHVQAFKGSGNAMDGNLVPGDNWKGFMELNRVLPDLFVL